MRSDVGFAASMKPRLVRDPRVRTVNIPGFGRVAYTRDRGEGGLFSQQTMSTRLRAIVRDARGRLVEQHDLGSGLVTNVGVLALAADYGVPGVSTTPASLFANLKWHAWGTGTTAAKVEDIKLQTPGAPNATECTEATSSTLTASGTGAPKFVSTGKIKAESSLAITEWGIHTAKVLSSTTGTPLVSETATTGKVTGTGLTASSATAIGETLKVLVATEASEIWGLITSNTTSVVTVPGWFKQSTGAKTEPAGTSPFSIKPVMFDHRVFSAINVETGNTIEFPWELTVNSGG